MSDMNENLKKNTKETNRLEVEFPAKSSNEGLARTIAASFASQLDPRIDELADLRTAVSEAVTNAIVHAYEGTEIEIEKRVVRMKCVLYPNAIEVMITDYGKGIDDVTQAREPLYTSAPEMERSGMGFTIMETFTDELRVESAPNHGTQVFMRKIFSEIQ